MKYMSIFTLAATSMIAGSALAQNSTTGTASGSSAPSQLGTPLNGPTNTSTFGTPLDTTGASPGTFGSLPSGETSGTSSSLFLEGVNTANQPRTNSDAIPTYDPYYPGYSLPVFPQQPMQSPQQVNPWNVPGTTSGTTSAPTFEPGTSSDFAPGVAPSRATPVPGSTP